MVVHLLRASAGRVISSLPQRAWWTPWTHLVSNNARAASTQRTRTVTSKEAPPAKTKKTAKETAKAEKVVKQLKTRPKPTDADLVIPPFSLKQLRDVTVLCGRNSSGTKADLRADLEEVLLGEAVSAKKQKQNEKQMAPPQRILSIDMGVRNLAYCLLEVGDIASAGPAKLIAWERLSLIDEDASSADADTDTDSNTSTTTNKKRSLFTPPRLAAVAARLVRDRLLALHPTHVLIERQRSRSGGGAAVLEWTLRVNALEAMLHGIFAYHHQIHKTQAQADSVQDVQAISPKRVSVFLVRGGLGDGTSRDRGPQPATAKEKDIKEVKEAFVAGLLRAAAEGRTSKAAAKAKAKKNTALLTYDDLAGPLVEAYLLRWDAKQSRGRPKTAKTAKAAKAKKEATDKNATPLLKLSKIDDLADCVAQGLIWLEWEHNKAILRESGAETLLAEKQLPG